MVYTFQKLTEFERFKRTFLKIEWCNCTTWTTPNDGAAVNDRAVFSWVLGTNTDKGIEMLITENHIKLCQD